MLAVLDALGIRRIRVVRHDVGGAAMQPLARKAPERLAGLLFFSFVYPNVGSRNGPDRLNETFPDLDLAAFPGVGHFPHREDPDRAAQEIDGFFARLGWR
jgi:pimeloyl-ACP methyl ester carboxylesterase